MNKHRSHKPKSNSPLKRAFLIDEYLDPEGWKYRLYFTFFRALTRLKILQPNTKIHYVVVRNSILILTPLAGSSSIRQSIKQVKIHDLRSNRLPKNSCQLQPTRAYILTRPFQERLTSFYNKKVRNPTSISKARLLATCAPLTWKTTPKEFIQWIESNHSNKKKDKHLYSEHQIIEGFGLSQKEVVPLTISEDKRVLEELLELTIGSPLHSTSESATFAAPLNLPHIVPKERNSNFDGNRRLQL